MAFVLLTLLWGLARAGEALVVERDIGRPDAFVVLASHEWERLPSAADLARRSPASLVLLTVPVKISKWNCHLCSERKAWLQHLGIGAERVIELPLQVGATRGEALAVREYARANGLKRLVVVTSPYHARRALNVFQEALQKDGVVVGVSPATSSSPAVPRRWWAHRYDRAYVAYEWAALFYYRARFGIPMSRSRSQ